MGVVTGVMGRTPVLRPADEAARGIVWAATAPELRGAPGGLYMRRKELKLKGAATDRALAETIWTISEALTGVEPQSSAVAVMASQRRRGV
jgi:hypothetical protein